MNLPFHTILGPPLKRNRLFIRIFCQHYLPNLSKIYVQLLAVLGLILSIYQILITIKYKCFPQKYIWRIKTCSKRPQVLKSNIERDLKLLGLFISLVSYFTLTLGVLTENAVFFLPYLALYAILILLEMIIFFLKVLLDGLDLNKNCLVVLMFLNYNWLCVFCFFTKLITICEL